MHSTLSCGVSSLMCDETTTPLVIWTSPGLTNASVTVQLRHAVQRCMGLVLSSAAPIPQLPIPLFASRSQSGSLNPAGWSGGGALSLSSVLCLLSPQMRRWTPICLCGIAAHTARVGVPRVLKRIMIFQYAGQVRKFQELDTGASKVVNFVSVFMKTRDC